MNEHPDVTIIALDEAFYRLGMMKEEAVDEYGVTGAQMELFRQSVELLGCIDVTVIETLLREPRCDVFVVEVSAARQFSRGGCRK